MNALNPLQCASLDGSGKPNDRSVRMSCGRCREPIVVSPAGMLYAAPATPRLCPGCAPAEPVRGPILGGHQ